MMKIKTLVLAAVFVGGIFSAPALAAETDGPYKSDPPQTQTSDPSKGTSRGAYGTESGSTGTQSTRMGQDDADKQMMLSGLHRSDSLVGSKVVAQDGKELGSIKDLVITQDGRVSYIILQRGGVLGVGGNTVPIPWEAANLQMGKEKDEVTASITQDQLAKAPSFEGDDWAAQISSPAYEDQVHSYFGTQPQSQGTHPQTSPVK